MWINRSPCKDCPNKQIDYYKKGKTKQAMVANGVTLRSQVNRIMRMDKLICVLWKNNDKEDEEQDNLKGIGFSLLFY